MAEGGGQRERFQGLWKLAALGLLVLLLPSPVPSQVSRAALIEEVSATDVELSVASVASSLLQVHLEIGPKIHKLSFLKVGMAPAMAPAIAGAEAGHEAPAMADMAVILLAYFPIAIVVILATMIVASPDTVLVTLMIFSDFLMQSMGIAIYYLLVKEDIAIGLLFAGKPFFQILATPFIAKVMDGREVRLLQCGLSIQIACCLVFAFTFQYATWFCLRAVSGIGASMILPCGLSHLNKVHVDPSSRDAAVGIATGAMYLAYMIGPGLGGKAFEIHPQLPFLALAELQIAALCASAVMLGRGVDAADGSTESVEPKLEAETPVELSMWSLFCHREVFPALFLISWSFMFLASLEAQFPHFMATRFGAGPGDTGISLLPSVFGGIIGLVSAGFLPMIATRQRILLATAIIAALTLAAAAAMPEALLAPLLACFTLFGAMQGTWDVLIPALLGDMSHTYFSGSGRVFTLFSLSEQVAFVIGPIVGSAIVTVSSIHVMHAFYAVGFLGAAAVLQSMPSEPGADQDAPIEAGGPKQGVDRALC